MAPLYVVLYPEASTGRRSDNIRHDLRLLKQFGFLKDEPRLDLPPLVIGDEPLFREGGSPSGLDAFTALVEERMKPRRLAAEANRAETRLFWCGRVFRNVGGNIVPTEAAGPPLHKALCAAYSEAEERLFLVHLLNLNDVFLREQAAIPRSLAGHTRAIERAAFNWCFRAQLLDVEQAAGHGPGAPRIIKRLGWAQTPEALFDWVAGSDDNNLFELW